MDPIRDILQVHPYYGYRRSLPDLEERAGQVVNHERLRRLFKEHELGLPLRYPTEAPRRCRRFLATLLVSSTLWPALI